MSAALPELSSLGTNLHDVVERIGRLAKQAQDNDDLVSELYEVERALINADRRLQKLLTTLNSTK